MFKVSNRKKSCTFFSQLQIGSTFEHLGEIFMKINIPIVAAVKLSDGGIHTFQKETHVIPVDIIADVEYK